MEEIYSPLYSILIDVLGEPGKKNDISQQYGFNCIECSNEKGIDNDGKYNLELNLKKGVFKCWACSETNNMHGSLRKLIKKYGTRFQLKQYLNLIDDDFDSVDNNNQQYTKAIYLPKELIYFKDSTNKNDLAYKEAINYLFSRGIDTNIINEYNVGYCDSGKYHSRIIIPSYDLNNKLNYFVSRSFIGDKIKYKNPPVEKMDIIPNESRINFDNSIFLVEGFFDLFALFPLKNTIPLIGKVMSDYVYYALLNRAKGYIIVVLDSDARINSYKLYKRLHTTLPLKGKIRIVDLPENSDLSDIRRDFGLNGIREILKTNRRLELDDFLKYNI